MSFADVVGSGRGTLCGKRESSNAMLEGIDDILIVAVRSSIRDERDCVPLEKSFLPDEFLGGATYAFACSCGCGRIRRWFSGSCGLPVKGSRRRYGWSGRRGRIGGID